MKLNFTHEEKTTVMKLWGCWTRCTPSVFWSSFWIWSRRSLWQIWDFLNFFV